MAGIGFRLQKLLSGESYTELVKAFLYSSFIVSGPMLVVILSLALINQATEVRLTIEEKNLMMGLVVYIYAFSMVGVGPILYVVTRYLADMYYLKKVETFAPTYMAALQLVFAYQLVIGIAFLTILPLTLMEKWIVLSLYLMINGVWVAMVFLSAARHYNWIFAAYAIGAVMGIGTAMAIGRSVGFTGFLAGYTVGQGICFGILTFRIFKEFGFDGSTDYGFLKYFRQHYYLALVGLCYYLGIWADKVLFWFSPGGKIITTGIRILPDYDTPMFLSFLTIIPSMAFFLVQMETSFVKYFRAYYDSIRNREDLQTIRACKDVMILNLTQQFQKFVLFQGLFSGVIILSIYEIAEAFFLNPYQIGIFRIGILGAFLLMGYAMIINILFYFDFQKDVFYLTLLFLVSNVALTWWTLKIGLPAYGFGFAGASFISVLAGVLLMDYRIKDVYYYTFMKQPIIVPHFKLEAEWVKPVSP